MPYDAEHRFVRTLRLSPVAMQLYDFVGQQDHWSLARGLKRLSKELDASPDDVRAAIDEVTSAGLIAVRGSERCFDFQDACHANGLGVGSRDDVDYGAHAEVVRPDQPPLMSEYQLRRAVQDATSLLDLQVACALHLWVHPHVAALADVLDMEERAVRASLHRLVAGGYVAAWDEAPGQTTAPKWWRQRGPR